MKYTSTRSYESEVAPGVTITLRKVNEKRRAELMRQTAPFIEQQRAIAKKFLEIQARATPVFEGQDEAGNPKPKMDPITCEQVTEYSAEDLVKLSDLLTERDNFETLEVNPIYIRWGVSSVDGLEIDGRPATVEDLLGDDSPDGLVKEILAVLQGKIDLSSEKKSASSLPSTSGDPAPDQIPHSSVITAEQTAATPEPGTVPSISQS
jgi:hypothetical protein